MIRQFDVEVGFAAVVGIIEIAVHSEPRSIVFIFVL